MNNKRHSYHSENYRGSVVLCKELGQRPHIANYNIATGTTIFFQNVFIIPKSNFVLIVAVTSHSAPPPTSDLLSVYKFTYPMCFTSLESCICPFVTGSFTWNIFKIHRCWTFYQNFICFYRWLLLPHVYTPRFVHLVNMWDVQTYREFLWVYLSRTDNMPESKMPHAPENGNLAVSFIPLRLRREDDRNAGANKAGIPLGLGYRIVKILHSHEVGHPS